MFHPQRDEIAHYFRFEQLLLGRAFRRGDTPSSGPTGEPVSVDWGAVYPMPVNPKSADCPPGTKTRDAIDCFNGAYCNLLQLLERTFNGLPMLLKNATGAMYGLKQWMINLMAMDFDGSVQAGPSFEQGCVARRWRLVRAASSSRLALLEPRPGAIRQGF